MGIALRCMREHDVDIAVFAEWQGLGLAGVAEASQGEYCIVENGGCDKVRFLVRKSVGFELRCEQSRYSISLASCYGASYLIAGLHLQTRLYGDSGARINLASRIMADVAEEANATGCGNVVVIGDFNANPYDLELIQPDAFNAVLFKDVINAQDTCSFAGVEYRRLYNPAIDFLSEDGKTYGSYYWTSSEKASTVWHCLDQVLVSASLVDRVADLRYLREIDGASLMNRVKPNGNISDHLPLLVKIADCEVAR